jgi:hypothetical protein
MVTANSIEMTSELFGNLSVALSRALGECKSCPAQPVTR